MAGGLGDLVAPLDPALAVVTVAVAGERAGCLVGFHSQCSIEPERYAVWLSEANRTTRLSRSAPVLAVHLLERSQHDLAALFGGSTGDEVDKFARCDWVPGPDGVPLLRACPHRFVGRPVARLAGAGDHECVVLEPVEVGATPAFGPLRLAAVADVEAGHPPGG
ncbi:MAG: flavin reductase family protein [Acidimicrobiia bacterium]